MYNANKAYFARDVMNEMYAAGDDSNCVSDLYSSLLDDLDVLFPVYLNSDNKKYTASRDSECFTSLKTGFNGNFSIWQCKGDY